MPSLLGTLVANNYRKHSISQSDAGREIVVSVSKTNITDDELFQVIQYMTTSHGVSGSGDSAFTVAALGTATGVDFESGATDVVFLRLQGTGEFTVADQDAGVAGVTVAIVAEFKPRF